MDTPSKETSEPQHRLFDVKSFEQDIATQMPYIRESSRRLQAALGVQAGTRIVIGKCWEMPRPPKMGFDDSDDDDDDDDGVEGVGGGQGSDEYYGCGSDDRKSVMDEQDEGVYDDGVYDDEETESASPSLRRELEVHEDAETLTIAEVEDQSEDELSPDADVRSIDRENIAPKPQQCSHEESQASRAKLVALPSQKSSKRKFESQDDQIERDHPDGDAPPRNYVSVPQGRRRRSNEPTSQETDMPAETLPADSEQTMVSAPIRLRPADITIPARQQSNANDSSAVPAINLIAPSPGVTGPGRAFREASALDLDTVRTMPSPATLHYNATQAWLRSLPPSGQFADPFIDARARLAALTFAHGPMPPIESILAISAPVQVHTMQQAARAAQAQQLDYPNSPVSGRLSQGPFDPRLLVQSYPVQGRTNGTRAEGPSLHNEPQRQQSLLPRPKAPLNLAHQYHHAPRQHATHYYSHHHPQHPHPKTLTHVPASPPPVYRSPPRLLNRLEAPTYWSSTLSTTLHAWLRNTFTHAVQSNLTSLTLTSVPQTSNPAPPVLRYDATFFAKLKWSRLRLPSDARCASRREPVRDWYVLELMSDTHVHAPATLARNDPAQGIPFSKSTTDPALEIMPLTPLPSPDEKPYWLMAFPVSAVTEVQKRKFGSAGGGVVVKTRMRVGEVGRVPLLHGRSVNPWFLEGWVAAFSSGEGMVELVSEGDLPL